MKKKVEILAPAKNLIQGMAAINAGADAVYIGAPQFGARTNATNSIEDITEMVRYAHLFKAQVFVVINTILYDNELEMCKKLIYQLPLRFWTFPISDSLFSFIDKIIRIASIKTSIHFWLKIIECLAR